MVFGDATLMQMARDKPTTSRTCWRISGVGQHKLEKYGDDFLDAIAVHCLGKNEQGA